MAAVGLKCMVVFLVIAILISLSPASSVSAETFTVTVSPDHGPLGTTVTVSSNNAPPSSPINIVIGNTDGTSGMVVASTTSGGAGRFSRSFVLRRDLGLTPGTLKGIWAVANAGTASQSISNVVVFAIDFSITVTPTSGPRGTTVTVSGTNAPPNANITVFVGNVDGTSAVTVATARSGGRGVFATTFVLGNVGTVVPNSTVGIFARATFGGPRTIPSNIVVFTVTAGAPITFTNLQPGPWATVSPGLRTLGARVTSGGNITGVTLQLSGVGTVLSLGSQATTQVDAFTSRDLGPGSYTLTMQATDSLGRQFTAQWDFTVGSSGESQWFTPGGAVKAANFNATTRSLVEAFRYHLFGQSWDDSVPHPEMPTHASTITAAEPLRVWAPQNGSFDQQYTTATLKSLVEAFRWHLFGVSWQTAGTPAMVTHATTFTGPQPIQPWFDSAGNPIRSNMEATLISLVQAMRWHFFGFTWDGAHHNDIPTHAAGV